MKEKKIYSTIDEYILLYPETVQKLLNQIRAAIKKAAPEAEERISYGMPGFYYKGPLVYFAANKNHLGFYATASANPVFKKELATYKTGKGSIQFPLDQPLPLQLIDAIVRFRVEENINKDQAKKKTK